MSSRMPIVPGAVVTEHWRRRGCCTHRLISGRRSWKPISPMSGSRRSTLHRWLGVGRGRTHVLVHTCSLKDMYVCTHTHTRMRTHACAQCSCTHACMHVHQACRKKVCIHKFSPCVFLKVKSCVSGGMLKKKKKKVQFTLKVLGLLQLHCDSS